jgi:hypothetical protein
MIKKLYLLSTYARGLEFASPRLKHDREVVLLAVRKNGIALYDVVDELKNDEAIRFTSEKFQADHHTLVRNAVMRDYRILHELNPMYKQYISILQLIPPEQRTLEQKRLLREKGSVTKAMRKVGYNPIVSHKIQQMLGTNQPKGGKNTKLKRTKKRKLKTETKRKIKKL